MTDSVGGSTNGGGTHMYECTITFAFRDGEQANICKSCMEVDDELQPEKVTKRLTVEENRMIVHIQATDLKMLRVASSSFFDMVAVSVDTLFEFDAAE